MKKPNRSDVILFHWSVLYLQARRVAAFSEGGGGDGESNSAEGSNGGGGTVPQVHELSPYFLSAINLLAVLASLVTAKIDTGDLDIFKVGWCYRLVSELIDKLANVRLVCAPSKHTVTLTREGVEVLEGVDALCSILCLASRADEVDFAHEH